MPNSPVSINPPATTTIPLDTAKTIAGLSISDADDSAGTYIVSLMPGHGTLSLGSDYGITYYPDPIIGTVDMGDFGGDIFSAPPPGSLFIGGTLADINTALATLIFTPSTGYFGPGEIKAFVSDPAPDGETSTSDYELITLSIGGNQAPEIANLGGDTVAYVEESLPVYLDLGGNALITDDNANFDGGSLTIAIINRDFSEDILLFDENVVSFNENDNGLYDVIVDGVAIGEMPLEYATPADDLAIAFYAEATAARVAMLLGAVTYNNLDFVDPTEGTRTVRFTLTDSSGPDAQSTTVDSFITVTDTLEINRAALLDLDSGTPGTDVVRAYTEGAVAIPLAPLATTDDPDLLPYNGGSLTIAVTGADAGDQLTIVNGGGVVLEAGGAISVYGSIVVASSLGGTNGSPLVLNFLPVGSVATTPEHIVDELVQAIRYRSTSDAPEATRTITFTLNDGGGTEFGGQDTAVATATVNVTGVNDAPVLTVQDATVGGTEDIDLVFDAAGANAITVADIDDTSIQVTLTVLHGTLTLSQTAGLTFGVGDGADDATMSLSGSTTDINAALEGLVYRGSLNYEGGDTLSVAVDDGDGSDSGSIAITLADDGQLDGATGNDVLTGTPGVDYFDLSQGGTDTANGDDGDDAFYFGAAFTGADTVDGGAGANDQIGLEGDYTGANALLLGAGTITGVEVIGMLPGFDYDLTTVDENVPAGGVLKLFAGSLGAGDTFTFDGSAELDGGFMVFAGAGTDHITTGAGTDGIYFGPGKFDPTVDRVNGGSGTNDQLALDGHYVLMLDGTAIQNIDVIALLRGIPGDLADYDLTLDDSLIGAGQTMTIWGSHVETAITVDGSGEIDGSIKMFGGTAGDTLTGGNGADWFWGGRGGDALTGGGGADTFFYEEAAQSRVGEFDTITGFNDAEDKIDLDGRAVTSFAGPLSGALDTASIGTTLQAAFGSLAANQAAVFTATGGDLNGLTFLLVDGDGTTGFQAGSDFLIAFASPTTAIDQIGMFV